MDRKPQRPRYGGRPDYNKQQNTPEKDRNSAAGRPAGTAPGDRRQTGEMPQRRAVRYPGPAVRQQPKRRGMTPLGRLIAIVGIAVIIAAVVLAFRLTGDGGTSSGKSGDTGSYGNADISHGSAGNEANSRAGSVNGKSALILLDAGHGFGDIGCSPDAMKGKVEKDITMKAVRLLKTKLEARGYTVIMTHDGESFTSAPELTRRLKELGHDYKADQIKDNNVFSAYERTMWANVLNSESQIGVFISLHVNSNEKTSLTGFTVDYSGENDFTGSSEALSKSVCNALERDYPGRSCKLFCDSWEDSYIVTKYSMMPSCLIEMGYGSSPADAALLLDDTWLDALASSIADGVDSYYRS